VTQNGEIWNRRLIKALLNQWNQTDYSMLAVQSSAVAGSDWSIVVSSSRHLALSSSRRISSVICGWRWTRSKAIRASLCSEEMLSLYRWANVSSDWCHRTGRLRRSVWNLCTHTYTYTLTTFENIYRSCVKVNFVTEGPLGRKSNDDKEGRKSQHNEVVWHEQLAYHWTKQITYM